MLLYHEFSLHCARGQSKTLQDALVPISIRAFQVFQEFRPLMYEPTQVPPIRHIALKFTQVVHNLRICNVKSAAAKQLSVGPPKVDVRNDAPCTSVRPVSPGLPGSENASTTLRRFSNATPAAFAFLKSTSFARLSACRVPASRARSCCAAISAAFGVPLILISLRVCMSAAKSGRCANSMRCSRARMPNDDASGAASSSGCTSVRARSHEVQVSVLEMVPRTTCGRAVAAFWASSKRLARFFVW
jgi:hypothetical protein